MGSGCLTCCRWCCCCFISFVNVLTTILGLTFLAAGCAMLWFYWAIRTGLDSVLSKNTIAYSTDKVQGNFDINSVHKVLEQSTSILAAVLIILGIVLIVFSCLGCCGACFGVPACLIIYAVFIGLVLLSQAALVIVWFTNANGVNTWSRNWLEKSVINYKGIQNADACSLGLDFVQLSLGCCGLNNGNDFYAMSTNWNRTIGFRENKEDSFTYYNGTYPYSCCKWNAPGQDYKCAYSNVSEAYSNYKVGCYQKMVDLYENSLRSTFDTFFYSIAGCLGMEILLLLGALLIYYHKRQQQEDIPHSGVQYKMQPQMA